MFVVKKRFVNRNVNLSLGINKGYFFDRQKVINMVNHKERRAMTRIGGWTRTTTRNSMKASTKRSPYSRPERAPKYHTRLLKDQIFFSYSPRSHSVVIGAEKKSVKSIVKPVSQPTVPALLEYGGTAIATSSTFVLRKKPLVVKSKTGKKRKIRTKVLPPGPRHYKPRPSIRPAFAKATTEPKLKRHWQVL